MKKIIRITALLLVLLTMLGTIPNSVSAASGLSISVSKHPTVATQGSPVRYGKAFGLRGSVTSNYKITCVEGSIINSNGDVVMSSIDYPNSTSMDIRYSQVNNALIFNKLLVGRYRLVIVAKDSNGSVAHWECPFDVGSLEINMTKCPQTLYWGQNFGLRGTITSNYAITEVKGQIILSGCQHAVMETIDRPYSRSFNVRYGNINNYLEFNRLTHGRYILRVTATDASGQTVTNDYRFIVKR